MKIPVIIKDHLTMKDHLTWNGKNVIEFRKTFDKKYRTEHYMPNFFSSADGLLTWVLGHRFKVFLPGEKLYFHEVFENETE